MRRMPLRLLSRGIEILAADGRFEAVDGRSSARPVILLARDLCAFENFRPDNRSRSAALANARLYARRASPFLNTGCLIRRQGADLAIWWWDMDLVAPCLRARFGDDRIRVMPLSLAQPAGDGWRIVNAGSGYDAQFWSQGALIASAWNPEMYDRKSWLAFTRLQRQAATPQDPPAPISLPVVRSRVRAAQMPDLTPRDLALGAAAATAIGLVLTTVFSLGQGARLANETRALVSGSAPSALVQADTVAAAGARQRLRAYQALSRRPDPLAALAVAMGILDLYDVDPTAYAADPDQVSLTLPYEAISNLDRIAGDLRDSGMFTEVRTATDDAGDTIELSLALAPASPGE